jgi:hypothetical protein
MFVRVTACAIVSLFAATGVSARAQTSNGEVALTRATPRPTFAGRPIREVNNDQALAYARDLHFDSTALASDAKTVASPTGEAVRLAIAPEIGSAALSTRELAEGRIISRVWSDGTLPGLGLVSGMNYLWVNQEGGQWRVLTIGADGVRRADRPLILHWQSEAGQRPVTRIVGRPGVVTLLWGICGTHCCGDSSLSREANTFPVNRAVDSMLTSVHAAVRRAEAIPVEPR